MDKTASKTTLPPVLPRHLITACFVCVALGATARAGEAPPPTSSVQPAATATPPTTEAPTAPQPAPAPTPAVPTPSPPAAAPSSSAGNPTLPPHDELLDAGRAWLEDNFGEVDVAQLTPADLQQLATALRPVVDALASGDFDDVAAARPQAAQVLAWLRHQPWGAPYADWLEPRMDFFDMAAEAVEGSRQQWADEQQRARTPAPLPATPRSTLRFEVVRDRVFRSAQSRRAWDRKIAQRQPPPQAARLAPQLKEIFRGQGIPVELVWLAEVESSFDSDARSPVGARGLFQLMPATAERFGLHLFPVDDRNDPDKNARAAAQYLRVLHGQFGDWPLVLAAYNAGEGRVAKELGRSSTRSFDAIADRLPAETRLYVPKVMATIAARENMDPFTLAAPTVKPPLGATGAIGATP